MKNKLQLEYHGISCSSHNMKYNYIYILLRYRLCYENQFCAECYHFARMGLDHKKTIRILFTELFVKSKCTHCF